MPSIHFHGVDTRLAAESLLHGRPQGSFVTWRSTESTYFITFVSNATRRVEHLRVTRLPADGGFILPDSRTSATDLPFNSLEDLVASRRYLLHDSDDSNADGGFLNVGGLSMPASLRLRKVGGAASLPAALAAPVHRAVPTDDEAAEDLDAQGIEVDESKYIRGVRPVASEKSLARWLGAVAWGAAALAVAIAGAHAWIGPAAKETLYSISSGALAAVLRETSVLYTALRAGGAGDEVCVEAVGRWRAGVSGAVGAPQAALDSARSAVIYVWALVLMFAVAVPLTLTLFCVHTGRKAVNLTTPEGASERPGGRHLCAPLQWVWTAAFLSSLICLGVLAHALGSVLGGASFAVSGFENVARTLSLQHSAHVVVSGSPLWTHYMKSYSSSPAAGVRPDGASDSDVLAWHFGTWGAAQTLAGAPETCMRAIAKTVDPLINGPPLLRLHAFSASPGRVAAGADTLTLDSDVFGWTWARGWFSRAPLALVVPSESSIAHATIIILAFFVFSALGLLVGIDWWYSAGKPAIKRWWARRRQQTANSRSSFSAPPATSAKTSHKD